MPGATPFTRTPRWRYSAASALVSMSTPPFDAAYAAFHGLPTMPDTEVVFTITPPPASSRCGSANRHTRNVPRRFTAMIRSNTAGSSGLGPVELADPGDVAHHVEPAELGEGEVDGAGDRPGIGHVALVAPRVAAGGDDLRGDVVVTLHVETRDRVRPRPRGADAVARADPGPRAGDERSRPLVPSLHGQTRSRSSYFRTLPLAFTGSASTTIAAARHLVVGHARRAPGDQLVGVDRPSPARGTTNATPDLAHARVGHADHRDLRDVGMLEDRVLDLGRVHVEPADDEHVLLAVGDLEVAALVHHADVAGVQPAVGVDRLARRRVVLEVARPSR